MLSINRSLVAPTKYVSISDPALDTEAAGFDFLEYRKTGDEKHLPLKGSDKPTVFHLKPLSMRRMQKIVAMGAGAAGNSFEQLCEAVAYGLKKVDGFEVDGRQVELSLETVNGEERMRQKSLETIFNVTLFRELGYRILDLSDLSF